MTDEEITALKNASESAVNAAKAEAAEARAAAAKAEADKLVLIEEVKTERTKKQEALAKANITNDGGVDVNALVEQALKSKDEEHRKAEIERAVAEFKSSKPEFVADSAGLVYSDFAKQLGKFNFADIRTKEEAKARLEEIYRFANNTSGGSQGGDSYEGSPQGGASVQDRVAGLDSHVQAAVDASGVSKEKFTSLKTKWPEAFGGLGIE